VLIPDPGIFSVIDVPGFNVAPQALALAGSKHLWMVDSMMNRIGRFDLETLRWNIYNIQTANSQPMDVEIDAAGDVWFTENDRNANALSRLVVASLDTKKPASPPSAYLRPGGNRDGGGNILFIVGGVLIGLLAIAAAMAFRNHRKS
jgi:hypothetical protein